MPNSLPEEHHSNPKLKLVKQCSKVFGHRWFPLVVAAFVQECLENAP